jgi:hypothetical protein
MITCLMFRHPCRITKWNDVILQILEESITKYHKNPHHIQITIVLINHISSARDMYAFTYFVQISRNIEQLF